RPARAVGRKRARSLFIPGESGPRRHARHGQEGAGAQTGHPHAAREIPDAQRKEQAYMNPSMISRLLPHLAAAGALLVLVLIISGCAKPAPEAAIARPVQAQRVALGAADDKAVYSGEVRA